MAAEENGDMGFQQRNGDSILNCPTSGMNTTNPFLGSGWDPLVSLSQSENFGGSFGSSNYSNLVHYPSDSALVEMVPKLPFFGGGGNISEMVGSFGLPNYAPNEEDGNEKTSTNGGDQQVSEEGTMAVSPCGKRKKRVPESNSPFNPSKNNEGEQQMDISGDSSQEEKKQKSEQNPSSNSLSKQMGKQAKEKSDSGEAPKENYIHVRAKRGQATNSHSLAERVRRERISERMRLLQELVPGCNKITGKAVMLDEIINYVQSLQQQVEFLSMKLASVNPELNIDIDRILSKEILHSVASNAAIPGFGPGLSSSHPYSPSIPQGVLSGIPNTSPYHGLPQNLWEHELQSLLHMGYDSNPAIGNLGPNGRSKLEL